MEKPIKGDLIVIPFPFSDLSGVKRRPAMVIASLSGDDLIVCQITSQLHNDSYAIELTEPDIQGGFLAKTSYICPNRLLTIDRHIVLYIIGRVIEDKIKEAIERIRTILET